MSLMDRFWLWLTNREVCPHCGQYYKKDRECLRYECWRRQLEEEARKEGAKETIAPRYVSKRADTQPPRSSKSSSVKRSRSRLGMPTEPGVPPQRDDLSDLMNPSNVFSPLSPLNPIHHTDHTPSHSHDTGHSHSTDNYSSHSHHDSHSHSHDSGGSSYDSGGGSYDSGGSSDSGGGGSDGGGGGGGSD